MAICAFELIDDLALPGTQTEAQQWTQAMIVGGVALGASLSGAAVDLGGPAWAFIAGSVFIVAGALMVNLRRDRLALPTADHVEVPGSAG
jgi:predicted MFS family arabinose efflux permease